MEESEKNIRNDIIQKFCQTIVWIDDDIHLNEGLSDTSLFGIKYKEFTDQGLLCHLMGFPTVKAEADMYADRPDVDMAVRACIKLSHQSDIVIVDWKLGSKDSSAFAEKIIMSLLGKTQGFRFIVILTKADLNDEDIKNLDDSFASFGKDGDLWKNTQGQFLLNLKKEEGEGSFEKTPLFPRICNALLMAYPDYLHLAALEIAGRIKDFSPHWLAAIPANTDMGILVERGNTLKNVSWNEELQECVNANLLEDLSSIVLAKRLEILNPEELIPSKSSCYDKLAKFDTTENTLLQAIGALKQCVDSTLPNGESPTVDSSNALSKKHYETMSDNRNNNDIKFFVESIEAFAEFCDKQSGSVLEKHAICPGAVYEGLIEGNQSIAVCITSACDCLRSGSFLFLIGNPMPVKEETGFPDYKQLRNQKGGKTVLRINSKSYIFSSQAEAVLVKKREEIKTATENKSAKMVGIIRQDILNRLIGRYMSHTQRYGVNQPDIVRKLREEGALDE